MHPAGRISGIIRDFASEGATRGLFDRTLSPFGCKNCPTDIRPPGSDERIFCTNSPSAEGLRPISVKVIRYRQTVNRKSATCAAIFVRFRKESLPYASERPGGAFAPTSEQVQTIRQNACILTRASALTWRAPCTRRCGCRCGSARRCCRTEAPAGSGRSPWWRACRCCWRCRP